MTKVDSRTRAVTRVGKRNVQWSETEPGRLERYWTDG